MAAAVRGVEAATWRRLQRRGAHPAARRCQRGRCGSLKSPISRTGSARPPPSSLTTRSRARVCPTRGLRPDSYSTGSSGCRRCLLGGVEAVRRKRRSARKLAGPRGGVQAPDEEGGRVARPDGVRRKACPSEGAPAPERRLALAQQRESRRAEQDRRVCLAQAQLWRGARRRLGSRGLAPRRRRLCGGEDPRVRRQGLPKKVREPHRLLHAHDVGVVRL